MFRSADFEIRAHQELFVCIIDCSMRPGSPKQRLALIYRRSAAELAFPWSLVNFCWDHSGLSPK